MARPPLPEFLFTGDTKVIDAVEMHTTGEATRIIYSGFPQLEGKTLLQKRNHAKTKYDDIRRRIMLEPRGHKEMYGALLINETEMTTQGKADIGVLFMHNEGWSTMCGHATIALGRYLVDFDAEACSDIFPSRKLEVDERSMSVGIKLHCPCGVVDITVPVSTGPRRQLKSDPERPVSFINVDSFATGVDVKSSLPVTHRWPELGERTAVTVDFCYGGAFYCVINAKELGFKEGLSSPDIDTLSHATGTLKAALIADPQYRKYFTHPTEPDLAFLYGVIVTDDQGSPSDEAVGAETGLCFFADQQVDRSPTGSGVAGRRALAHAKGLMPPAQRWTYHSPVSLAHDGQGAFTASVAGESAENARGTAGDPVKVQVEGRAFYTGYASFLVEEGDSIGGAGFTL